MTNNIEDLFSEDRKHMDPLMISFVEHCLKGISNDALRDYIAIRKPTTLVDIHALVTINSIIETLRERKKNGYETIESLLRKNMALPEIVDEAALIMHDTIPRKRYDALVKKAGRTILTELRRKHYDTVSRQFKPFKAYSSLRFYMQTGLVTGAIIFGLGILNYNKWKDVNDLVKLGEGVRYDKNVSALFGEVDSVIAEHKKPDNVVVKPADQNFDGYSALERLAVINSIYFDNNHGGSSYANRFADTKIRWFEELERDNTKTPVALLIRFDKAKFIYDCGSSIDNSESGLPMMKTALHDGANIPGLFNEKSLFQMALYVSLEEKEHNHGNNQGSNTAALGALERFAQENPGTYLGDRALMMLASVYSPDRRLYRRYNGFIATQTDANFNFKALSPDTLSHNSSRTFLEQIVKTTNDADYYAAAKYFILKSDADTIRSSDDITKKTRRLMEFLDVAGTASDRYIRLWALMEAGYMYHSLGHYEMGNSMLEYVSRNTKDKTQKDLADDGKISVGWHKFWNFF